MLIIGITGGIGSGKSAVTERLAQYGVTIVDADVVAREIVEPGQPTLDDIARHFGPGILQSDGSLNRAALRAKVFNEPDERKWLESVTHPAIRMTIKEQLARADGPYAVLASPLLLESGQYQLAHYVVVVDVPESIQLERASRRDNNSPELIRQIMAAQLGREERIARGDEVLDNSGSLSDLHRRVDTLHQRMLLRARS